MGKFIYSEETPYNKGKYILKIHHENLPLRNTKGSYNVLLARIAGLSYANFLRMCRDNFGATIIGKNSAYPVAYFEKSENLERLVKWLDIRTKSIMESLL